MSEQVENKTKQTKKKPLMHKYNETHSEMVMRVAKEQAKKYDQTLKNLVNR